MNIGKGTVIVTVAVCKFLGSNKVSESFWGW